MRLIIDIPEEEWLFVKAKVVSEDDSYIDRAVANGIPFDKIRDEIDRLHYHPKLDFIKNDEVVEMALDIIDRHR